MISPVPSVSSFFRKAGTDPWSQLSSPRGRGFCLQGILPPCPPRLCSSLVREQRISSSDLASCRACTSCTCSRFYLGSVSDGTGTSLVCEPSCLDGLPRLRNAHLITGSHLLQQLHTAYGATRLGLPLTSQRPCKRCSFFNGPDRPDRQTVSALALSRGIHPRGCFYENTAGAKS